MKKTFKDLINSHNTPVLVDFYADWCGPCKMMKPVLRNISNEFEGKLKIIKVDADKNPKAVMQFQIKSIPTFILFNKGKILWRFSGALAEQDLKKQINALI